VLPDVLNLVGVGSGVMEVKKSRRSRSSESVKSHGSRGSISSVGSGASSATAVSVSGGGETAVEDEDIVLASTVKGGKVKGKKGTSAKNLKRKRMEEDEVVVLTPAAQRTSGRARKLTPAAKAVAAAKVKSSAKTGGGARSKKVATKS